MKKIVPSTSRQALAFIAISALCSCAPQREFVRFGDAGIFHPGPQNTPQQPQGPQGEYDSYELVDHGGVPNQGIPPMYSGQQGNNYPSAVPGYDAYGNPVTVIVPNPW